MNAPKESRIRELPFHLFCKKSFLSFYYAEQCTDFTVGAFRESRKGTDPYQLSVSEVLEPQFYF